jgi:hypothetical protein
VGAFYENSNTAAAYIYTTSDGTTWNQIARISSNIANSYYGSSLALNALGTVAIVGASAENNNIGAAYVYKTTDNVTWNQTARISNNTASSQFGNAVTINSEGSLSIVAAVGENSHTGAFYTAK